MAVDLIYQLFIHHNWSDETGSCNFCDETVADPDEHFKIHQPEFLQFKRELAEALKGKEMKKIGEIELKAENIGGILSWIPIEPWVNIRQLGGQQLLNAIWDLEQPTAEGQTETLEIFVREKK